MSQKTDLYTKERAMKLANFLAYAYYRGIATQREFESDREMEDWIRQQGDFHAAQWETSAGAILSVLE